MEIRVNDELVKSDAGVIIGNGGLILPFTLPNECRLKITSSKNVFGIIDQFYFLFYEKIIEATFGKGPH